MLTLISTVDGVTTWRVYLGTRMLASFMALDSDEGTEATRAIVKALTPKPKATRGPTR